MSLSHLNTYLSPILLLRGSTIFLVFAWYGHVKYKASPLWLVIAISWDITFFEYCLRVPANCRGYAIYSAAQLKGIQKIISLIVIAAFLMFMD
jgi:uncharacterized protein